MANKQISEQIIANKENENKILEQDSWIGELMRAPAPSPAHQLIVQKILRLLYTATGNKYIILQAPCDLQLSLNKFRQPDLMIISHDRKDIIADHAVIGPPDAVIEVLSPSSHPLDCREKLKDYAKFGIKEYWIVDPERHILLQYILPFSRSHYVHAATFQDEDAVRFYESSRKLFKANDLWN